MNANVIETNFTDVVARQKRVPKRDKSMWSAAALASFGSSGVCFVVGILLAAATALGVVAASRLSAYADVAILLSAFLLAFLGAHALDRIDEIRRTQERDEFHKRNGSVIDLTTAKNRLAKRK